MQTIFKFNPIYKERPWGGQSIARIGLSHRLPAGKKIGESWEISDRDGDESMILEGAFKGKSIRWLLDEHGSFVMGCPWPKGKRFPLLIKLLDAAERLSLQVHPPALVAAELGGEPKTEMWYLLAAKPDAAVLAGLRKGTVRDDFEKALRSNALEPLIHRIPVRKGDSIFIPSGRIHAIDAGCLILEIQQNSDTTYRVYDWGRVGLDGKARELHIPQSLRSIDFNDVEPKLSKPMKNIEIRNLVECEHFCVEWQHITRQQNIDAKKAGILHVLQGAVKIISEKSAEEISEGETALLTASSFQIQPIANEAQVILARCNGIPTGHS